MRKLASIQEIKDIKPIKDADSIEVVTILGWHVVVLKDEFKIGDKVVYCEIDSILPEKPEFEFLRDRKFRIKTIKLRGQISQGIAFPMSILPEGVYNVGDDVTDIIGIIKYDNENDITVDLKEPGVRKKWAKKYIPNFIFNLMCKLFPKFVIKHFIKPENLFYNFPGFVSKSDEIRCQVLQNELTEYKNDLLVGTEKIDGTSCTIYLYHGKFGVCNRKVEIGQNNKSGKFIWNIVIEQDMENKLRTYFGDKNIALQGECHGAGIQGNKYQMKNVDIRFFNIYDTDSCTYYSSYDVERICKEIGLNSVPIVYRDIKLTSDDLVNELLILAEGKSILNPKVEREGIVWRQAYPDNTGKSSQVSFKSISNKFLLKFNDD